MANILIAIITQIKFTRKIGIVKNAINAGPTNGILDIAEKPTSTRATKVTSITVRKDTPKIK